MNMWDSYEDLIHILIFNLNIKKKEYEKIHRQFIKNNADRAIHFSRGRIEGIEMAIEIAQHSLK